MTIKHIGDHGTTGSVTILGEFAGEAGALILAGPDARADLLDNGSGPGALVIGAYGSGAVVMMNRSRVVTNVIDVAKDQGGRGLLAVTGGSTALATDGAISIGRAGGSNGTVNVSGAGSLIESRGIGNGFCVGESGNGRLNILSGGNVQGAHLDIGGDRGGRGQVSVDGFNSLLFVSDLFHPAGSATFGSEIGLGTAAASYGRLDITQGGQVVVRGNSGNPATTCRVTVGGHTDAQGVIEIRGDDRGSAWLYMALEGPAVPGRYSANGFDQGAQLLLGVNAADARVTVGGGGNITILGDAAQIVVGVDGTSGPNPGGTSLMEVLAGGDVLVSSQDRAIAASVTVGAGSGSDGTLVVRGPGARLTIDSNAISDQAQGARLTVSAAGVGTLEIDQGGVVMINSGDDRLPGLIVGGGEGGVPGATGVGIAAISGPGSALIVGPTGGNDAAHSGLVAVGYGANSYGLMFIDDGGRLENLGGYATTAIAMGRDSFGSLTVTGFGSELRAGALISVGHALEFGAGVAPDIVGPGGRGELTIGLGATVFAQRTLISDSSRLDMDGTLNGQVEVAGTLALRSGEADGQAELFNGSLRLTGTARLEITAEAILDDNFADRAIVQGELVIDAPLDISLAGAGFQAYVQGQQIVLFQASAIAPFADQDIAGTDFILRQLGNTVLIEATASRDSFSFRQLDTGGNKMLVTDDAGSVQVLAGGLVGQTATGVQLILGSDQADRILTEAGLSWGGTTQTGAGNDLVLGSDGDNLVFGEAGADRLIGRGGDDRLDGGAGRDVLAGGRGRDLLDGGAGNDQLSGDIGADRLIGGAGNDTLTGGAGADVFVFEPGSGQDRITDFALGIDRLEFTGLDGFADLGISQTAQGALVADGDGASVLLLGILAQDLTTDQFLF